MGDGCVLVCVHGCMRVCVRVCMRACVHVRVRACVYLCTYVRACACDSGSVLRLSHNYM